MCVCVDPEQGGGEGGEEGECAAISVAISKFSGFTRVCKSCQRVAAVMMVCTRCDWELQATQAHSGGALFKWLFGPTASIESIAAFSSLKPTLTP